MRAAVFTLVTLAAASACATPPPPRPHPALLATGLLADSAAAPGAAAEGAAVLSHHHRHRARPAWDAHLPVRTNRPLVGVLSQTGDPAPKGHSYIAASYVKLIEAAGARAVPFFHDMPDDEIVRRFNMINAFLIPGGGAVLRPGHTFFDVAARVVDLAAAANDKGDHFPVLAICLGFEAMAVALARNSSLLTRYDAEDGAAPLFFTQAAERSAFFGSMPDKVRRDLADKPYARESHSWGVSLESFDAEPGLKDAVDVLSLSADPEGRVYVSSYEHRTLPFVGTQWHPEKNAFEWGDKLHIPHAAGAVAVTHAVASFLARHARASGHAPGDVLAEDDVLIYNHPVTFTGRHKREADAPWLDQAYILPPWADWVDRHPPRQGDGRREGGVVA